VTDGGPDIDVSIILITFNDAARLPRALASLSRQTLRNLEIIVVDDASTDTTAGVVAAAMAGDARIRYVRIDENSGGCSAPRNRGVREARGIWVMFCDSDDEYERHAAKNLLLATERAQADLGCGVVERVDVKTGAVKRWHATLHEPAILESIAERPDLIADTVSVNKIYRRSWLIERGIDFPEGLLYEDQLFTMKAFAEARRICVIAESVYFWYVERLATELSITQRRHELRNVRGRIEVNRQIDDYLAARGLHELARTKTRKFLVHDLYLYLATLLELDDERAAAIAGELVPYVESLDLVEAEVQKAALRVATYHLLAGDLDGIRRAMRYVRWSSAVDVPVVTRRDSDGNRTGVFWGCEHLEAGPRFGGLEPHWWLDVSGLGIDRATNSERRWCHRLAILEGAGGRWTIAGRTVDAFGDLGRARSIELVLVSGARVVAAMPLTMCRSDPRSPAAFDWNGSGMRPILVSSAMHPGDRGFLAVRLVIDDVANVMPVRVDEWIDPARLLPGIGGFLKVRSYRGEHGVVRWHAGRFTTFLKLMGRVDGAWSGLQRFAVRAKRAMARRIGEQLPAAPLVVFLGAQDDPATFSGQVRAIASGLQQRRPEIRQVWVGSGAASVRRAWHLARARWWVLDTNPPLTLRPPARARVLATTLAVPVARVGVADPDWDITSPAQRRVGAALPRRWDVREAPSIETARGHLDLPRDRINVLYAPLGDECLVDLGEFVAALGDRVHLLVASGTGRPVEIPSVLRTSVRDVSASEVREWAYAGSDLLITDFSPLMVEFAAAERPIVIYSPVFDRFVSRTKGTMIDLVAAGPGPIARTMPELITEVSGLVAQGLEVPESFREQRRRFAEQSPPMPGPQEFVALMLEEG
jgi:CDP-glycerol glycerophosphotransferase